MKTIFSLQKMLDLDFEDTGLSVSIRLDGALEGEVGEMSVVEVAQLHAALGQWLKEQGKSLTGDEFRMLKNAYHGLELGYTFDNKQGAAQTKQSLVLLGYLKTDGSLTEAGRAVLDTR